MYLFANCYSQIVRSGRRKRCVNLLFANMHYYARLSSHVLKVISMKTPLGHFLYKTKARCALNTLGRVSNLS